MKHVHHRRGITTSAVIAGIAGTIVVVGLIVWALLSSRGSTRVPVSTTGLQPDATSSVGTTSSTPTTAPPPEGTIVKPDGAQIRTDGSVIRPDGTIIKADGTMVTPDGTVIKPSTKK